MGRKEVVKDEKIKSQSFSRGNCENFSYAVDLAADGDAGLQMAIAFEYDLMILIE
jgi:DNA-binding response OmpR family regulator